MAKDVSFYTPAQMGGLDAMVDFSEQIKTTKRNRPIESRTRIFPYRLGRIPRPRI